ncbi:hypothetical protein [Novosphingobium sp. TH158]|uniref:hypothetical protein n=1 Tax=Novosphingobium sp. TH158 TaxID=2067455 RepID=UPI000C7BD030|nr:hypothetical protein [Novosphingobium sp. TH158]PLK26573.1 hypothetical protein C0V78_06460 [Novosphingobium sp. TH158]
MAKPNLPVAAAALSACLLLSACGDTAGYPSLARRPAERITDAPPPPPAPAATPQPLDPAVAARLGALVEQARKAHAGFIATRPKADRLSAAAKGAAVASEAWVVASVALAELESRRSEAMVALAELDSLYARNRVDGGDGLAIAAARDQVTAWVADEDAALAELRGRLRD